MRLVKFEGKTVGDHDKKVLAYWLMYLRAPAKHGLGETDLGEIGAVVEKTWERMTPYSIAEIRE